MRGPQKENSLFKVGQIVRNIKHGTFYVIKGACMLEATAEPAYLYARVKRSEDIPLIWVDDKEHPDLWARAVDVMHLKFEIANSQTK